MARHLPQRNGRGVEPGTPELMLDRGFDGALRGQARDNLTALVMQA
jgi:hypothetical protein